MALYQTSVLKKYLADQDHAVIGEAYKQFTAFFHDPKHQQNIREAKEEQYQEGFLRDLFVNILGYTMPPKDKYNLTTELKNLNNARKTDGAILKDGNALAVIELKGTDTKDLDKVNDQAFAYKNNHPDCVYVITSNFEKLRFFIHNTVDQEDFNLFTLTLEEFKILWLFLHKDNLLRGIPEKVKTESLIEEEKVTKRLYAHYSAFKQDLWQNMVKNNPGNDELELYKKSQKLLDRFLFIFFAEDKGLLPPNSISVIIADWEKLKELDAYKALYARFKKYFGYLNDGYKGKTYEIHAYNGGLFKPDTLLDGLTIDDEVLSKHTAQLTDYDFGTEIDVNILGHIFEHSLNEIENVRAQLAGEEVDQSKTKRKKDGVFYTPKYITKYIVENTVGKLCDEKKAELEIDEEEFAKERKGRRKATLKKLDGQLKAYRAWLLQLTICDPACGSGAFLNQALEFLIAEHHYLDELEAQLLGYDFVFPDVENHILEHNLFGVDINEESVEIARLSLWLRTAQKGRKLTSLSSNIKVGNSLIDDPEVAGDLAFNWEKEFPKVFGKGGHSTGSGPGFDVVIGNPPYVVYLKSTVGENTLNYLSSKYSYSEYNPNTYALFTDLGLNQLLLKEGRLGFIIPNSWMSGKYFTRMRQGIYNSQIEEIDYLKDEVFAEVVETVVLMIKNLPGSPDTIRLSEDVLKTPAITKFDRSKFLEGYNPFIAQENPVVERIEKDSRKLGDVAIVYRGLETKNNKVWLSESKDTDLHVPILLGRDVHRYSHSHSGTYVKFIKEEMKSNANEDMYTQPKVLMRRTGATIIADLDLSKQFALKNLYVITPQDNANVYSIVAQLNSRLFAFIHEMKTSAENKAFAQFQGVYVANLPYKEMPDGVIILVENIQSKSNQLGNQVKGLIELLQSKFPFDKPSKKLQNWPSLTFKEFLAELKKKKVKLSLAEEAEWMDYFTKKNAEANELQAEIDRIDREIDQMVYELYGLTEEEIEIVENS